METTESSERPENRLWRESFESERRACSEHGRPLAGIQICKQASMIAALWCSSVLLLLNLLVFAFLNYKTHTTGSSGFWGISEFCTIP
jgi:hypothetical protein